MAQNSEIRLTELRKAVTSKGGTTEAGLKNLTDNNFQDIIKTTLKAAYLRSKELSQIND